MSTAPLKKAFVTEIAIVRILTVVFQLVFLKIYTHFTTVYELGIYYFLFTISYSLNAFLLVPLDYFQQSKLYKLKNENASLKSFYGINVWILKFSAILLFVTTGVCYFVDPSKCIVIVLITLLSLSTYFVTLIRNFTNNLERRRFATYTLLLETIIKVALLLLYIHLFSSSAVIILTAALSASLVILTVLIFLLTGMPEFKLPERYHFIPREIITFSYPISVGAIINWIQLQSYTIILVPLGFVEAVGIFGTVANVGSSGMNACSTVFSQLYTPNIYKTEGLYIKTYLRNALLLIAFVLTVSAILSDVIVDLLTKHSFVHYSLVILYGVLTEAGNFIIGGLTVFLTIHSLTKTTVKMSVIGVIVFFLCFAMLYVFKSINVYTLGIPMVLTQIVISAGLFTIIHKAVKQFKP